MGGKNHQPCRKYLANSTKLSRSLSLAFIEMERGNLVLEDIILEELAGKSKPYGVHQIKRHLEASAAAIESSQANLKALVTQMDEEGFADLPSLEKADLTQVGIRLAERGMTNLTVWNEVQTAMEQLGFVGMTGIFEKRLIVLKALTESLISDVGATRSVCEAGELMLVLEENRDGNFKTGFAKLYQSWASFQQLFLASSLCSTELWYRFNRYGSLVLGSTETVRAA